MESPTIRRIAVYLLLAFSLAAGGWLAHGWYDNHQKSPRMRRVQAKGYRFTSPLLDVELPEGVGVNSEPLPFKHKVKELIQAQIGKGQVREVAVYYRDLHDGPWFGINEDKEFDPVRAMFPRRRFWCPRSWARSASIILLA